MDPSAEIAELSAFATALHDINSDARQPTNPGYLLRKPEGKLNRVGAAVLDALAELIVYEPDQAVALAAVLDGSGHIELYIEADVAQVPPKIIHHLNDICSRILSIRAALEASPDHADAIHTISKSPHIPPGSPKPALDALRSLDLGLYRYSVKRIRAQLTDPEIPWADTLTFLVACLKDPPAADLDDMSAGERVVLRYLQQSPDVQRILPKFDLAITSLRAFIDNPLVSDDDYIRLRQMSIILALAVELLKNDFANFDHFVSVHVARKVGTPPRSPPNTVKWLKKVSYVARAYRALTEMLTTPALSALFGASVSIHPVANPPPARRQTTPTAEDIKATLTSLGYTSSYFIASHPEKFDDFVGELTAAATNRDNAMRIHCECALLCHLRQHDQPMLPYIGLSNPPCIFCTIYFAAYRNTQRDDTTTRGTEGHIAAGTWTCPNIPDMPDAATIRLGKMILVRLSDYIHGRLREETSFRRRKTLMSTQSTLAPNDTKYCTSSYR
ncbi:uncharacterized protein TRAVEDRAFT_74203 [Trametes versicolor FP-101664 SS1]|uniref:uncharacterized protein n=1 Tax=Trametes versicolor (strain FP-101664) TaxID=717944 RepID=UPI0004624376|nr:uncharacterized protein TRAVEDRAFT_74203 [Trametes versicolor FP-101664 SS1]EIW55387.1 hypothetical protein TRAVEDRAFT_74203 [Trametes versicolor FP-101664 SS1]